LSDRFDVLKISSPHLSKIDNSYCSNVQIVIGLNSSFMPSSFGVNALGTYTSQTAKILSQLVTVKVSNRVSTTHEKFTIERILYVPVAENVCVGVKEVEVLFAPLEGSPKSQLTLDTNAPVKIENEILFSRHVSFAAIDTPDGASLKTVTCIEAAQPFWSVAVTT
jgi:hypothetical protein